MEYYIGIDLGTSSVKSLLMDEHGAIIGTRQVGYDILKPALDRAEQDMEQLWAATCQTLQELVRAFPRECARVSGISYSGQMHGLVAVGGNGRPVRDAIIWADQRSGRQIDRLYEICGRDTYRACSLNSLSTGFMITSLMWIRDNEPEVFERICTVLFPKDYIRYRMCGELATEKTDASSGAIFDTTRRDWAWSLIDRLELPRELFPTAHESYETAGYLTRECADETGLKQGIRIVYGGGDTLMVSVGNSIIRPGVLASNIGTACQLATAVSAPLHDPAYRTNTFCHVHEQLWLVMGAHLSGGVALKWLKGQMPDMRSYDDMTALAATVPAGSEGMVFLPYLSGERTPYNDPNARAIYFGMTLKHGRAHMIRSTMEGIIFGLRSSLDILRGMGVSCDRIIASGGAARGPLFLQMQADNFDCEIYTNEGDEQAGIGAAITAAIGCGRYSDYREACSAIVRLKDTVVVPDPENRKRYEDSYGVFRELYAHNRELFHRD